MLGQHTCFRDGQEGYAMRGSTISFLGICGMVLACVSAHAETIDAASAELQNVDGQVVGIVALRQTDTGGVWLNASFSNLPFGTHAFHIHEAGECEGDFKSAGGHYAPAGNNHGVLQKDGPHAGDLPNIHVPADGRLNVEVFAPNIDLARNAKNTLFDEDGSALVVHAGVDDYKSQPSGDAGARIACGVVTNKIIDSSQR
ncbi:superoxide dismutase family protein [Candidatus Filomicrobium marinum]|nr:superoxide dismutase family protein [Candidatus Filomicrobium marinum]